jgi:hypothetical protein
LVLPAPSQETAAEGTVSPEKGAEPPKSQEELAERLLRLLGKDDFEGVQRLMLPPEVPVKFGLVTTEKRRQEHQRYTQYVKDTPELAKRYKSYLKRNGVLPIQGLQIKAQEPRETILPNGKKLTGSSGVLLVDENGKVKWELIDRTAGFDGNWYILDLATEDARRKMDQDKQVGE